jgi:hypothetical protein
LKLEGGKWHINRIWTPSIHIPNNKQPDVLQNGDNSPVLTHIYSNGEVLVSKRFSRFYLSFLEKLDSNRLKNLLFIAILILFRILLNGVSKMNFRFYPLDIQLCDIEIESSEYSFEIKHNKIWK